MSENTTFTVHHLRFEVEALTPLLLPAHAGLSIRGALFGALQRHFCPAPAGENPSAEHKAICPVCWLMATEKPQGHRGRDVPRPYTVEPPIRRSFSPLLSGDQGALRGRFLESRRMKYRAWELQPASLAKVQGGRGPVAKDDQQSWKPG